MKSQSVLIIGCGSIGERHLRCFLQTGRVRVTACDTDPALLQSMAERYQTPGTTDWKEAVRGDCDAVVVCTPAQWHVPMAQAALEAGKHVLIEKPLSSSLEGVDALLRHHESSGYQVAVAYIYHVFPFLAEARDFLNSGAVGAMRQAVVVTGSPFQRLRPSYAQTYYRDHRTGGGAVQDGLTHIANWMESVLGPADSVLCDCAHLTLPGVEVEDTVHLSARHGGVLVSYAFNQFQVPHENSIQFNAERGSVRIDLRRQRWGAYQEGDSDWVWREGPPAERDAHFTRQAENFLDQMKGKPARLCSLKAAAQTLRFNLAALASAKRGARVRCDEITTSLSL
jgi:predicted dehydrogenase